eukprot:TRINITY_DN40154_c0_g1_i1.p1 TRINITY_DN40154_c0_g1~~TRINITY_DN40154_c0_g1_i1.p1  ORF type:complete len:495 (-),score=32.60 TRINITY_DN40154_c0_g1_i1:127-1611(-)
MCVDSSPEAKQQITDAHEQSDPDASRGLVAYSRWRTHNWGGNIAFKSKSVLTPANLDQLQSAIKDARQVRVVGRGHSFTPLCECEGGVLVSLAAMNSISSFAPPSIGVDGSWQQGTVVVEGGTTYTELIHYLTHEVSPPCALKNLSSLPQATIAGACATGTHGSGIHNQNLATHVSAIEFVTSDGTLVQYDRDNSPDELQGAVINLGCLGVVSKISVDVVPWFDGHNFLYDVEMEDLWEHLMTDLAGPHPICDAFSILILDWKSNVASVLMRCFSPHWDQSVAATHPDPSTGTLWRTGKAKTEPSLFDPDGKKGSNWRGPWHDLLSVFIHDGVEDDLGDGQFNNCGQQAEFFVPIEHSVSAIMAISDILKTWSVGDIEDPSNDTGILYSTELRVIKGDPAWLSPHAVDSLAIHFNLNGRASRLAEIQRELVKVEHALAPFGARPHWGKLGPYSFSADRINHLYGDSVTKFKKMAERHDPTGKFRNLWVRSTLGL